MGTARRNFLKFAGGATAGILFTPAPWKTLDDISIWSQNWGWLPRTPRGEVTQRFTNCALCPAGCGVKAKCVAGRPFQLSGIAGHPVGRPTLCPAGLAAHQVPFAPGRVMEASLRGEPVTLDKALERAAEVARAAGSVLIVDGRPGRSASDFYRRVAAQTTGWRYAAAPRALGSLNAVRQITGEACGIDCENVRTVVSFGAPVLHGWSTPGRLLQRRGEFHLIQIEPSQSRSAAFADEWFPIQPGQEGAIALQIAHVLLKEKLVPVPARSADWEDYLALVEQFPPESARVKDIARMMAVNAPSVALPPAEPGVVKRGAETAIAGLNVLLGTKAALTGRANPGCVELDEIADGSVDLLIADRADGIPVSLLRRKLAHGGALVAVAVFAGELTSGAEVVIPAASWMESEEDVPGDPDGTVESFAVSAALLKARAGTIAAAEAVARISGVPAGEGWKERATALHGRKAGTVFQYADGTSVAAGTMKTDAFVTALSEGAAWIGEKSAFATKGPVRMMAGLAPTAFAETPMKGSTVVAVGSPMPPVPMLGKLYQESKLYAAAGVMQINAVTAEAHGLSCGARATVKTRAGSGTAAVRVDESAAPGLIRIEGAQALRLCDASDAAWRMPAAEVRRA